MVVIVILQSFFFTLNACEGQVENLDQSSIAQHSEKKDLSLETHLKSLSKTNDHSSSPEHQKSCHECKTCTHIIVSFLSEDFNFLTNDFYTLTSTSKFIYQPPYLYFSKKPPIKA